MVPLFRSRHHIRRYREIASILARHGLGWVVLELGLGDLIPFHRGLLGHPRRDVPYSRPEHFRMALEDLGVVFIKLGQVLSTRSDMLPPDYVTEFARLQDAAPPVPYAEVAAVVEAELNRIANRLSISVLTAALIISLGLLMLVYHPPGWATWGGWFFGLAFVIAFVFGLGLSWSIWRSR